MTEFNYTVTYTNSYQDEYDYGYDNCDYSDDEVEYGDVLEAGIMQAIDSLRANGYAVVIIAPQDIQSLPGNPSAALLESSAKTGIALTFGEPYIY